MLGLKVGLGVNGDKASVILDTAVTSSGEEVPALADGFEKWMDEAHEIASAWFKGITAGALYETFEPN